MKCVISFDIVDASSEVYEGIYIKFKELFGLKNTTKNNKNLPSTTLYGDVKEYDNAIILKDKIVDILEKQNKVKIESLFVAEIKNEPIVYSTKQVIIL